MSDGEVGVERSKLSRVRLVRCVAILLGGVVLLAGIILVLWFRAAHRADSVEVEIHSLPVDVNYVCLATCDAGKSRLLGQYRYDLLLLPCFHSETPDGTVHHPTPVSSPCAAVAWREAERYVVLWRDLRGRWYRRSIESNRVRSVPSNREDVTAEKVIEFLPSDKTEEVSAEFLMSLGIPHPEGDAQPWDSPPGIRSFHEFEGRFDEAMVLLNRIEGLVSSHHDDEAVDRAHELSRNIAKMLATIRNPTPEQRAAAAELEAACENFSISPGTWPVNTLKVTARWESLLRLICGNE